VSSYLARVTVRDVPDDDTVLGMSDALGAVDARTTADGAVVFEVPGEAPDRETAIAVATRHAAEVLDGFTWDVEAVEDLGM
jgi:hypothetical protein